MYSIICHTLLQDGHSVLIGDPAVCEFFDRLISVDEINKGFIRIRHLPSGGYFSYHYSGMDAPAFAKELLFLHDSLRPWDELHEEDLGLVCTALSDAVFICDESKSFDASFSYFLLEDEALYDAEAILKILNSKESLLPAENELKETCLHCHDGYIKGSDIFSVTGSEQIPDFLRTISSTHWSADIARKLSHVPACSVVGGVVSNAYSEFVHVYALYRGDLLVGIRICLDEADGN